MASKLCSMREALADGVRDGDTLFIDGFTHLICFAAGHEIIRQGRRRLTAVRLTPDLVYDQLLEAGCVDKLVFSWAGNPGVGSLHGLRRKSEAAAATKVVLEEYSHFGLLARLMAGAAGLPFWPLDNFGGSDIAAKNPAIRSVDCPYTGKKIATVPALRPDVTVVHCQRADAEGNAQVWGLYGSQKEAAFAAKKVIVVAEQIVPTATIRRDPNRTMVPGMIVSHVVHEPWGCHPSFVQGFYDRDNDFYVAWEDVSRQAETYADWLAEFVHGVPDRAGYMKKLGGPLIGPLAAQTPACAGRGLGERDGGIVGSGLPNLACNLAREVHAPDLFMIYESGAVGAVPERLPVSIGDPALVTDSLQVVSQADIFQCFLQRGLIEVGFLGGAQIDKWGNINTTVIGDYANPKVRLPGSGGACEIAVHSKRLLVIMRMSKRAFVEKCDFVTSPGHRTRDGKTRADLGLPGGGPTKIISDLGVLEFDPAQGGEAVLTETYPGVTVDQVRAACGWDLKVAATVKPAAVPDAKVVGLLRDKLDPQRLYL